VYRAWHAAAALAAGGTADPDALVPTAASAAAAHVDRLARGYAAMVANDDGGDGSASAPLQLDCACGIGASPATALAAHPVATAAGLRLVLRNAGRAPGSLNARCGADYVQKARSAPLSFEEAQAGPSCYAAALDGDADRCVFFATSAGGAQPGLTRLLDGDKTAALVAQHVAALTAAAALPLRLAVVQTAYANGGNAAFLRGLGAPGCAPPSLAVDVLRTPTGVKHLHAAAERYDVGIYWESNGHGAALFSEHALKLIDAKAASGSAEARALAAIALASNPAVGDGLSGALIVDAVLRLKRWGLDEWDALYTELPSRQLAVRVADRAAVRTAPGDESIAAAPAGLQAAVEAAVAAAGGAGANARAFARASGTEDVVRVYAEAATQAGADALAANVARAVHALAAGVGDPPPLPQ
jgi:phosphoacetylglucosamine mutase